MLPGSILMVTLSMETVRPKTETVSLCLPSWTASSQEGLGWAVPLPLWASLCLLHLCLPQALPLLVRGLHQSSARPQGVLLRALAPWSLHARLSLSLLSSPLWPLPLHLMLATHKRLCVPKQAMVMGPGLSMVTRAKKAPTPGRWPYSKATSCTAAGC